MDQEQFEEFFGKLKEIDVLCEFYNATEALMMFNKANNVLNIYGSGRLEEKLRERKQKRLVDNLERVAPHGGVNYYDSVFKDITSLLLGTEDEIQDSGLDISANYLVGDEPLVFFYPDEKGEYLAYLFCPEGEYREEAKSIFGEKEFHKIFNENDTLVIDMGSSQYHSEELAYPNHLYIRTPVGEVGQSTKWIDAIETILTKSVLYEASVKVRQDE